MDEAVVNGVTGDTSVACDPVVMGGTPVFAGTRVPVRTLLAILPTAAQGVATIVEL